MRELSTRQVRINDSFWSPRLAVNSTHAIFHQWEQLEATRCIDNFRIVVGESDGFREGWYFADSDAYKWLDAASRILALHPDSKLASLIFTYNQIHFPNQRWVNLQIEHELYCHGHLIEAGVSHYEVTGRRNLLDICIKAADLLVRDFLNTSNGKTCGHEEIELALIRLYRVAQNENYLELARQFIERRGRTPLYGVQWWLERNNFLKRKAHVDQLRQDYIAKHPEYSAFRLPGGNFTKTPPFSTLRHRINALRGFYGQQHTPIRKQTSPVGHSVRFGYLETAVAMLCRERPDKSLLSAMEQAWERMVTRRMYITGGLSAVPGIEGFGADYELDPEYASLASLFWNWEMALLTQNARYSDLFEWQLYNATNVGMGQNGDTYLYNNPLAVHQGVTRQGWYVVPCCPSNLSRTFADLGKYIYSHDENDIWIHQYVSSETTMDGVNINIESELPWSGKIKIDVKPETQKEFTIHVRKPSWSMASSKESTASGYDPRIADYESITRVWSAEGETLEFNFNISIQLRRAHPKVQGHAGKVTVTRGSIVYCLESVDNHAVDIFTAQLDSSSLHDEFVPDLLGGYVVIHGKTIDGRPLKFIPYFLWANRGEAQMTVWVNLSL